MKRTAISLAMLLVLAITSCKKNDVNTPTSTTAGTVTAGNYGFDGSATLGKFTSTKATFTKVTANNTTTFTVTAVKDGSNEAITIVLLGTPTVGKTSFGGTLPGSITISKDYSKPSDLSLNYSTERGSNTARGGGEIIFTKVDGNIVEGTFYAVGYNNANKEAFAEQGTFSGTIQ